MTIAGFVIIGAVLGLATHQAGYGIGDWQFWAYAIALNAGATLIRMGR